MFYWLVVCIKNLEALKSLSVSENALQRSLLKTHSYVVLSALVWTCVKVDTVCTFGAKQSAHLWTTCRISLVTENDHLVRLWKSPNNNQCPSLRGGQVLQFNKMARVFKKKSILSVSRSNWGNRKETWRLGLRVSWIRPWAQFCPPNISCLATSGASACRGPSSSTRCKLNRSLKIWKFTKQLGMCSSFCNLKNSVWSGNGFVAGPKWTQARPHPLGGVPKQSLRQKVWQKPLFLQAWETNWTDPRDNVWQTIWTDFRNNICVRITLSNCLGLKVISVFSQPTRDRSPWVSMARREQQFSNSLSCRTLRLCVKIIEAWPRN